MFTVVIAYLICFSLPELTIAVVTNGAQAMTGLIRKHLLSRTSVSYTHLDVYKRQV